METETASTLVPESCVRDLAQSFPGTSPGVRLSEAVVLDAAGGVVRALAEGQMVEVRMALGYEYKPAPGDVLLVIGQEERHFAIGVIRGTGRSVLSFSGDADIRAPLGRMRLFAAKGVAIHAPEVSVRTGSWNLLAETIVEKAANACRFVTGLLQLRAGSRHTVVQGHSFEKAERVYVRAEQEVSVDGKTIQLG